MRRVITSLLAWLCCCGTTYYVSPNGDDSTGDGSLSLPWATIQKGVDEADTAGDIVCVLDGTYHDGFTMDDHSGESGNPIIVRNCEDGLAIIDQSQTITGWTSSGTNLWDTTFGGTSTSLIWRGTTWMDAPESSCSSVDAADEWCIPSAGNIRIYSTSDPSASTYRLGTGIGVTIEKVSYITIDGISVQYPSFGYSIGDTDSSPTDTANTSNITIQDGLIQYTGSRGMRLIGTSQNPLTNIAIDNMEVKVCRDTASSNGHCIKFDSNFSGTHNDTASVTNSTIHDCWFHCIQFSDGWTNGTFTGNRIYGSSIKGSGEGADIRCGTAPGCTIADNNIGQDANETGNSSGTGIYLQEGISNVRVYRNVIHDHDWHGIYVFSISSSSDDWSSDTRIFNNQFLDNRTAGVRVEDSNSLELYNNSFYRSGYDSISGTGSALSINGTNAHGVIFMNNACDTAGASAARCLVVLNGAEVPTSDYNVYYEGVSNTPIRYQNVAVSLSSYQSSTSQERHSVASNPQFSNPGGNVLSLGALSPARMIGSPLSSLFTTDYLSAARGTIWDIGAYENSTETTVAGVRIN